MVACYNSVMPEIFDSKTYKSNQTDDSKESTTKTSKIKQKEAQEKQPVTKTPAKSVDEQSETIRREMPTTNPLKAFAPKPFKVHFDSQLNGEHIVLMLRRHPVTQVGKIVLAFTGIFIPILFITTPLVSFMPPVMKLASLVAWYLLLLTFIIESFLTWFFNVFIITDERIIDVDFISLIYKNVSSAKIDNIEDITVITGGVVASVIDYGTVKIQTASEVPEIEFEDVPHPSKVARILNELILEEEKEKIEGRVR